MSDARDTNRRLIRLYSGGRATAAPHVTPASDDDEHLRDAEWSARPLGRLGRRLLAEVEPYLEFYAIARAE